MGCSGCLDGINPYIHTVVYKNPNPTGSINLLNLDDAPTATTTTGVINMEDSFVDYITFTPEGTGSIPVTIGKITWGVTASATYPNAEISQSVDGPTQHESEDFPEWTTVRDE